MVTDNFRGRPQRRGSPQQAASLDELEQQAAELNRVVQQVRSASSAIGLAKLVVNKARLRREWLVLAGQWPVLQCRLDESIRAYEAEYGPLGARRLHQLQRESAGEPVEGPSSD